jgi:predicted enzyme related to lactoylglutathione lyase
MQFYKDVFGWKFEESEGGQMEYCGSLLQAPRSKKELTMASPKEVRKAYA